MSSHPYFIRTSELPKDWDSTIDVLQQPMPRSGSEGKAEETRLLMLYISHLIALHWVVKLKWNSKHKIPFKRDLANVFKPLGQLQYQELELCIQCHSWATNQGASYRNAEEWFKELMLESYLSNNSGKQQGKKAPAIQLHRDRLALLKNNENPFNGSDSSLIHNWRLMEAATSLEKKSGIFYEKYWIPYLKAYSALITQMASPAWGAVVEQDDKLYMRIDRGRGLIRIDP